jgi:hypothetical protein
MACNFPNTWTFQYQSGGGYSPYGNHYITYSNCINNYCDFGGLYPNFAYGGNCFTFGATCGNGSYYSACAYSDVRLKEGIETLKNALENILKLEPVEYDWNENLRADYPILKEKGKLHSIGLIAQEVREYFPEVVRVMNDGYYALDYEKLNAVLVEAIKEQQLFIEYINKEIENLEQQLENV